MGWINKNKDNDTPISIQEAIERENSTFMKKVQQNFFGYNQKKLDEDMKKGWLNPYGQDDQQMDYTKTNEENYNDGNIYAKYGRTLQHRVKNRFFDAGQTFDTLTSQKQGIIDSLNSQQNNNKENRKKALENTAGFLSSFKKATPKFNVTLNENYVTNGKFDYNKWNQYKAAGLQEQSDDTLKQAGYSDADIVNIRNGNIYGLNNFHASTEWKAPEVKTDINPTDPAATEAGTKTKYGSQTTNKRKFYWAGQSNANDWLYKYYADNHPWTKSKDNFNEFLYGKGYDPNNKQLTPEAIGFITNRLRDTFKGPDWNDYSTNHVASGNIINELIQMGYSPLEIANEFPSEFNKIASNTTAIQNWQKQNQVDNLAMYNAIANETNPEIRNTILKGYQTSLLSNYDRDLYANDPSKLAQKIANANNTKYYVKDGKLTEIPEAPEGKVWDPGTLSFIDDPETQITPQESTPQKAKTKTTTKTSEKPADSTTTSTSTQDGSSAVTADDLTTATTTTDTSDPNKISYRLMPEIEYSRWAQRHPNRGATTENPLRGARTLTFRADGFNPSEEYLKSTETKEKTDARHAYEDYQFRKNMTKLMNQQKKDGKTISDVDAFETLVGDGRGMVDPAAQRYFESHQDLGATKDEGEEKSWRELYGANKGWNYATNPTNTDTSTSKEIVINPQDNQSTTSETASKQVEEQSKVESAEGKKPEETKRKGGWLGYRRFDGAGTAETKDKVTESINPALYNVQKVKKSKNGELAADEPYQVSLNKWATYGKPALNKTADALRLGTNLFRKSDDNLIEDEKQRASELTDVTAQSATNGEELGINNTLGGNYGNGSQFVPSSWAKWGGYGQSRPKPRIVMLLESGGDVSVTPEEMDELQEYYGPEFENMFEKVDDDED